MTDLSITGDDVRAVVFDLDGTLYRQGPVRRRMLRRLVGAHWSRPVAGLRTARMLGAYRHAQESLRADGFEGDVAREQLACASERCGADPVDIEMCVATWMEEAPLNAVAASARAGLIETLDALAAKHVRLAVVSDYPAISKLQALGVADHFDVVVTAQDRRVRAFKPNPRSLLVALEDLGVERQEALFVGDRLDVAALAAAAAGVRFVLIGARRGSRGARGVRVDHLGAIADGVGPR